MKALLSDITLAVVIPGRPGYVSIGENAPDVRRDFEKQGTVVEVSRSEAVRGFHQYANAQYAKAKA